MKLNQSPVEHGTTPEQDAIYEKVKEILQDRATSSSEQLAFRSWIISLVGFKPAEQWTSDEWDMIATQLEMPLSFYRG